MLSYLKSKILEVVKAILPLVIVIVVLQFTLIKMPANLFFQFLFGAGIIMVGGATVGVKQLFDEIATL